MTDEERRLLEDRLPVRNCHDHDALVALMEKNGETADDIVDHDSHAWRAADFVVGVVLTKKRLYTLYARFWDGEGSGYYSRIFVSELPTPKP